MGDYIFKHDESIILLHNGILRAEELCTLNISFHRTHRPLPHRPHHPSPPPPHLASWQEWRHCRWTNRFQLRSHSGCLIWGKSRCARQKAGAPFVYEFRDHLGDAVSFFFWKERKSDAGTPQTQNKSHLFSLFLQLISLNTYLLWLQRQSIKHREQNSLQVRQLSKTVCVHTREWHTASLKCIMELISGALKCLFQVPLIFEHTVVLWPETQWKGKRHFVGRTQK